MALFRRLLLALSLTPSAFAADLLDVYQQALDSDPIFKEAYHTYLSSTEAVPQAAAALYPQMSLTGQKARNDIFVSTSIDVSETYTSGQWQLTASQALFNWSAWNQVKQAKASVKATQAIFNDAAQDLMIRTTTAYMDALLAKDTLAFAEAKKRANKRQLDQAQQRFNVGLETITSVYEAKAAYDQSIAEVISAENSTINKSENIRKLTNHTYESLAPLRNSRVPLITPVPTHVEDWIDAGLRQNYKLFAARFNQEAARENIKVQVANNLPTVSLQANAVKTHNQVDDTTFFVPFQQNSRNIAVALNFPIFQGGLVVSQTRQAHDDFEVASDKFDQAFRDVEVNTRIQYNTIIDGISKVKADAVTVESQKNSLQSTEAQFEVGTRTMVDVVNAQQRLFDAQRQLAQDQYAYILVILNLKYLAGSLSVSDLEEVNAWLATTRVSSFPPKTAKVRNMN